MVILVLVGFAVVGGVVAVVVVVLVLTILCSTQTWTSNHAGSLFLYSLLLVKVAYWHNAYKMLVKLFFFSS